MSLEPLPIFGYPQGGLVTNKKPVWIAEQAFSSLENAYCWRDRVKEREGLRLLGRLQRNFSEVNYFTTGASPWTFNIRVVSGYVLTANNANPGKVTTKYPHHLSNGDLVIFTGIVGATGYNNITFTITVVDTLNFTVGVDASGFGAYVSGGYWISNRSLTATEPSAEIVSGSFAMAIGAITFSDASSNGVITSNTPGNSGFINYATGSVTLTHTAGAGIATTLSYDYYPVLPTMGIPQREIAGSSEDQTIWFDTRYAYDWSGTNFEEFIPGTSWNGTDSDFFWTTNYRGPNPQDRLFFATNFVDDAIDPIRYTDGVTWTDFAPLITATTTLFQARIIIPYYGRLLAFNTWEGTTAGGYAGAVNIFNRCRFSALGNPVASDAWRQDIFGKGGFIDAPTNESIVSAAFVANTLIVEFQQSTWQLRYVGEYGLPFIWERISADLGSESTFSIVVFDQGAVAVGDKAIITINPTSVKRIDLNIPDQVFAIRNAQNGVERVQGVRDFQREIVYWCYSDSSIGATYPNYVLLYNYRNNSFAIFRDNVTAFGTFLLTGSSVTLWSSLDVFWDDMDVTWSDPASQSNFPSIVSGNQQGFIHLYAYQTEDEPSLSITAINLTFGNLQITVPNHNLQDAEIIYIQGLLFLDPTTHVPVSTDLNDTIYAVQVIDSNTLLLLKWDGTNYVTNFSFTPASGSATYIGGGLLTLFPVLYVQTKDFNPYQNRGMQTKLSYIDFLMDATPSAAMSVILYLNTSPSVQGNLLLGNNEVETSTNQPFYLPQSDIAWHRFFATVAGQYFNVVLTYDDTLMNTLTTHQQKWVLNAMTIWHRPGGKIVF